MRVIPTVAALALVLVAASCNKSEPIVTAPPAEDGEVLFRVGTIAIYQADLDYHLKEKHDGRSDDATRELALTELSERASFAQAALDADLDRDPLIRAEFARLLATRLRETELFPKLKAAAATPISEECLRKIYNSQSARFASPEKRQVAVLWLKPGPDPARVKRYTDKLTKAREWFFEESDLADQPEKGFSVLSVDHSEHAASRFKGGVLGWIEAKGGATEWNRAVAEMAFSIPELGDVSPVTTRPEGVFLVRWMAHKPALKRSFDSARAELEKLERNRLKEQLEAEFRRGIQDESR
jgi:hypothetical protein